MSHQPESMEAFSAAFTVEFGTRAIAVAESQRDRAEGVVRERWQQIVDMLSAPASTQP